MRPVSPTVAPAAKLEKRKSVLRHPEAHARRPNLRFPSLFCKKRSEKGRNAAPARRWRGQTCPSAPPVLCHSDRQLRVASGRPSRPLAPTLRRPTRTRGFYRGEEGPERSRGQWERRGRGHRD